MLACWESVGDGAVVAHRVRRPCEVASPAGAAASRFISADVFLSLSGRSTLHEVSRWPVMHICFGRDTPRLRLVLDPRGQDWFAPMEDEAALSIYLRQSALDAWLPESLQGDREVSGAYFLSEAVAEAANDILACPLQGAGRELFLTSKVLGLIWLTLSGLQTGDLQMAADGDLSAEDVRRLHIARATIHEHYGDRLTLDSLSKACGLNRSKLTRGFRELFKTSVGEALSERRLHLAAAKLRSTDAPVSSVGYATGYTSNAAFTRAFTRRFGASPTAFRAAGRRYGTMEKALAAV